ncbi:MAG: rod shape-determining protein MreC [Betaproteobacteria bacterium]|jgi:rod shape-determining protein MreC|nr:rod shape-determining protein MreC [Betaproteobacteria bacterium]
MALSQSPPPLFKQGLPARLRMLIAVIAAIGMLYSDLHFGMLKPLRQGLTMVLYPIEQLLILPRDAVIWFVRYASTASDIVGQRVTLERKEIENSDSLLQVEQLRIENESLRSLFDLRKSIKHKTVAAQISHETRDAFSNRIVIDRGSQHGLAPGHPVINAQGVVGQVVRVSPITAEVSLVTDPSLMIPVALPRSGLRSLASGTGDGQQVELKYLNINAEVEVGDVLVTSGLDGLYPSGLPVAKINRVERAGSGQFPRITSTPVAPIGTLQHVLVILIDQELIPPAPRELDRPIPKARSEMNK